MCEAIEHTDHFLYFFRCGASDSSAESETASDGKEMPLNCIGDFSWSCLHEIVWRRSSQKRLGILKHQAYILHQGNTLQLELWFPMVVAKAWKEGRTDQGGSCSTKMSKACVDVL